MDSNEINTSTGVVLLLDALGVSQYGIDDSKSFLTSLRGFLDRQNTQKESKLNVYAGQYGIKGEIHKRSFGDTILLFWETGNTADDLQGGLMLLAEWLRASIMQGMLHRILWRGAFTVGGFVYNKDSIIGPAIADVASWYEYADWGGIIATPRCALHLEKLALNTRSRQENSNNPIWNIDHSYIKYQVPSKHDTQSLWSVAWPAQFFMKDGFSLVEYNEKIDLFYKLISQFDVPKGTESKYQNTEKFFLDYLERYVKPRVK